MLSGCRIFSAACRTFGNVAFVPHNVSYVQTGVQWVLNLLYLNGTWTWLVVYYFLGGVFMFFLMRGWNFSRPAALIAALTFMLSPYMVGLAGEGHGSKLMALSYLPLVVLLSHSLFERRDVLSFGLLAAAIGTLMLTNHMQIVYYVFMFLGLYLLYHLTLDFRGKLPAAAAKAVLFAGAVVLGFCISSYIYLSVSEYAQYSMRGGGTTGAPGGLAYDYATNWSWHPGELVTLLIPGFYGMKSDLYWGPMIPWTNSSVYAGLAPVLFGILALVYRRTRFVDISRSCAPRHRPRLLRQQFFTALQPAVLLSSVFQQVSGTGADSAPAAVCHGDTCRDRIFRSRRRPRAGFGDRYAQTLPGAPDRGGRHRGAPGDCTPATEQPARESSRLDVP